MDGNEHGNDRRAPLPTSALLRYVSSAAKGLKKHSRDYKQVVLGSESKHVSNVFLLIEFSSFSFNVKACVSLEGRDALTHVVDLINTVCCGSSV